MKFFAALGPGLIFAATAVGTSHLVQSTRAGAGYGLSMAVIIILVCTLKYPAFRFGTDYAAGTGESLVESYFRQGRLAVFIFVMEVIATMFVFTAAVTLVSAGIVNHVFSISDSSLAVAVGLLIVCMGVLISGGYAVFEKIAKVMVITLVVILAFAVFATVPKLDLSYASVGAEKLLALDQSTIFFLIAFAGFMPSGIGQSIFQSLWVNEKARTVGEASSELNARFDFNVGYVVTVLLAIGFLWLGTVLMHQPGVSVSNSSTEFSGQLIGLFTDTLGNFAYPLIAGAAMVVMLSSMISMLDACPRTLDATLQRLARKSEKVNVFETNKRNYIALLIVQAVGVVVVLALFMTSFKQFIDMATSIAFVTGPLIAILNHRAVTSSQVPELYRPSSAIVAWSYTGIAVMAVLAVYYLVSKFW